MFFSKDLVDSMKIKSIFYKLIVRKKNLYLYKLLTDIWFKLRCKVLLYHEYVHDSVPLFYLC